MTMRADLWIMLLVAGVLGTQIWRWAGVLIGTRLDEESHVFRWVKAVATSLIAAVVSILVVHPTGALGEVALGARVVALLAGFSAYLLLGQRLWLGILVAIAVLVSGGLVFA